MAAASSAREGVNMLKETFKDFSEDGCTSMAAALAYYTIFSLPPLLVVIITVAGLVLSPSEVEQSVQEQVGSLVGTEGAEQIGTMIESAGNLGGKGTVGIVLGIAALLFGATSAFAQLQEALNRAWEIKADPEGGGVVRLIVKRLLSLGMVITIAFLLLVSLALSTMLSAVGSTIGGFLPGGLSEVALFVINEGLSLTVITLLFAAIFVVLPDAKVAWRDVWVGAFATAFLFEVGKFAIGFYLGQSNPGEAFGAAGSLALLLVWIYYTAMILFFGAEFTQVWAQRYGRGIRPDDDAVRLTEAKPKSA